MNPTDEGNQPGPTGPTGKGAPSARRDPRTITRPDRALHTHYLIQSMFGLILFPLIYLPLRFKYRTLRYRFDDEGVSMSWGRFFQRETYLTYRRIQDIQVTRGVIQRRLGLADLKLQTASGGAGAEMKIEGIRDPDGLRDFLSERMRGATDREGEAPAEVAGGAPLGGAEAAGGADEALRLLHEIRDELRRLATQRGAE